MQLKLTLLGPGKEYEGPREFITAPSGSLTQNRIDTIPRVTLEVGLLPRTVPTQEEYNPYQIPFPITASALLTELRTVRQGSVAPYGIDVSIHVTDSGIRIMRLADPSPRPTHFIELGSIGRLNSDVGSWDFRAFVYDEERRYGCLIRMEEIKSLQLGPSTAVAFVNRHYIKHQQPRTLKP